MNTDTTLNFRALVIFISSLVIQLVPGQSYTDVTYLLDTSLVLEPTWYGKGISFYDIDHNGWDDLTISTGYDGPVIFMNYAGILTPAPFSIPDGPGICNMVLWGDYDNDGDADLLVTNWAGPIEFWQNDGSFTFSNIAETAGFPAEFYDHFGASACDYDHDGYLDLYVTKYQNLGLGTDYQCALYRNTGMGGFENVTEIAGVTLPSLPVHHSAFFDFNNDGWEDLFVYTDKPSQSNELFRNLGDGTFQQVTAASGMDQFVDAMSASIADHDRDGDLDVFVTNNPNWGGNLLMRNNGDGTFENVASQVGLSANQGTAWAGLWMDHDNNGIEDLFVAQVPNEPAGDLFYTQEENGAFVLSTEEVGLTSDQHSYGGVRGDIDNDGYYDFMVSSQAPDTSKLYRNSGSDANYLSVSLEGMLTNKDGIGSWITCHAGGQQQVRFTISGADYMGQSSGKYIFGLGEDTEVDSLVVEWNRGTREVYYDIQASQHLHLIEGTSFLPDPYVIEASSSTLCPGGSVLLYPGDLDEFTWSNGSTDAVLEVTEPGTYWVTATDSFGNVIDSEPITIVPAPLLISDVSITPVSCYGSMDGAISVSFSNEPVQSIVWNTGANGTTELIGLSSGGYSYSVVDSYGCSDAGGGFVPEPFPLMAEVTTSPASSGQSNGSATIQVNGGTPDYSVDWSSGTPNGYEVSGLAAGTYDVTVIDANGCLLMIEFVIELSTGISGHSTKRISIFPNPAKDVLMISGVSGDSVDLLIRDPLGRAVFRSRGHPGSNSIPIDECVNGTYILIVRDGRTVEHLTFIVAR